MAKFVLACDGGGIRGAASAEFLRLLEKDTGKSVYDMFDFFAGTSTGGIIAVGIGVLKMKAAKLAELYNYQNGNAIMNKTIWDRRFGMIQVKPKYDGKGKRRILKKYFGDAKFGSAKKPTMVVTYDVEKRVSAVLKSFKQTSLSVVEAADATSAAPTYFPTVKCGPQWLIDGGVIANNPSMCAYAEAFKRWKGTDEDIRVVNIGTGTRTRKIDGKESRDWGAIGWLKHDLLGVTMDETTVEYQMKTILDKKYLRINSELLEVSDDMDDCSRGNIKNLKVLGEEWYRRFGKQVKQLLS
ncbi:MAG: phospholipase [Chitinivibrionales bacterium]|nr:phospholipase [Chitinivibrionales bacterium]